LYTKEQLNSRSISATKVRGILHVPGSRLVVHLMLKTREAHRKHLDVLYASTYARKHKA
jgi:hypothetical protein